MFNVNADIAAIHKACKGFGTDDKTLIAILANRDGRTIDEIRRNYTPGNLVRLLDKEASGNFRIALMATAMGPIGSGVFWAHRAIAGAGTNEPMLTEAVMGRPNFEITGMKQQYQEVYSRPLDADVANDLSMKTKTLFAMALQSHKPDEGVQPDLLQIQGDVSALYAASKGRVGTDENTVCQIFTRCNQEQLRAIAHEYGRRHGDIVKMVKSEFSGHMREALLYIVEGAIDKARRDATLLEAAMAGFGTKDELLVMRVVRIHWDRQHLENVKAAYRAIYNKELAKRIKGETSGSYRDMLLELIK